MRTFEEEFGYSEEDHCYIHGYEPYPKDGTNPYKECYECKHIFRTLEDLLEDYTNKRVELFGDKAESVNALAQKITFCPHCTHDF